MSPENAHVSPENAHVCDMYDTHVTIYLWITCNVACVGLASSMLCNMLSLSGDYALSVLYLI